MTILIDYGETEKKIFNLFSLKKAMYDLKFLYHLTGDPSKETTRLTITLVDDDPFFLETLKDYLRSKNIKRIESYQSPEAFLALLKSGDHRIIVLDYDFGNKSTMNGLSVLDAIRKIDPNIPVIMLSAQDDMEIAIDTLERGAVDYILKGLQSTFTSVLASILKIGELQKAEDSKRNYKSKTNIISIAFLILFVLLLWNFFRK